MWVEMAEETKAAPPTLQKSIERMNFNFTCESERYFCERSASPVSTHFESAAKWTNPILCMPGEFDRAIRMEQAEVYPCATSFLSGYVVRYGAASERKSSRFSTPFCYLLPYDVAAMAECKASLLHTDKMEAIRRKVVQFFSEKGQRRFSLSLCWSGLRWPARLKCRTEQCTQPTISWLSKAGKVIKEKTEQLQGTFLDEMKAVYAPLIDVSTEVKVRRIQKEISTGEEAENIERRKNFWRRYF